MENVPLRNRKARELPRWVRRVLVMNRRVVMTSVPMMYILAVLCLSVWGAQMVTGSGSVNIDITRYPYWLGYFLLYGSIVLLLMFTIEAVRQSFVWSRIKGRKRTEPDWFDRLMARVRVRL